MFFRINYSILSTRSVVYFPQEKLFRGEYGRAKTGKFGASLLCARNFYVGQALRFGAKRRIRVVI